jgi:hypothetical protein
MLAIRGNHHHFQVGGPIGGHECVVHGAPLSRFDYTATARQAATTIPATVIQSTASSLDLEFSKEFCDVHMTATLQLT